MIMEQITNYVKPELVVVAIALYFVGMALKQAQTVKDKYIPLILGGISIAICAMYVFATSSCSTPQDIVMAIFTAITQGILIAGLSTYVNQIVKQANKDE
jgi:FtsH-binding integral membrane protein